MLLKRQNGETMKTTGFAAKVAFAALCAALCGCSTIHVSKVGRVMVDVENTNWLLFNFIPLASGNPERPNECDCLFFSNSVNLDNNITLVDYAVRKYGAVGVRDLVSYSTDEYVLFIFLKHHAMHTSAELVMPGDETRAGEVQKVESLQIKEEKRQENPTPDMLENLEPPPRPPDDSKRGIMLWKF